MPIVLQPTPRLIRRTHENFMLGSQATLSVPPGATAEVVEALRQALEELFPGIEVGHGELPGTAGVRLTRFDEEGGAPDEVPPDVSGEAFRLRVSPQGIEAAAGSEAGWLWAARALRGLREGDELIGVTLLDWPSFPARQVDLPWPDTAMSEAALDLCLEQLARARINRLGLPRVCGARGLLPGVQERVTRSGIVVVEPAEQPSFCLLQRATLFPAYSRLLPALQEAARSAEAAGRNAFVVALGQPDAQTSLEALAYGLLFAGDCAWNPQRADLKPFRRWYAVRRFGFDSRAPVQVVDELEAAAAELDRADGSRGIALEAADTFEGQQLAGLVRPEERAAAVGRRASAALAAMSPLQPDSEERAAALQGLQWSAQRLKMLSRRLGAAERVRELYRSAYIASASPKAVSDRLLKAADLLESEARALDEHRAEWHALWCRERREPYDPATESAMRAHVEALRARAARMRALRDRYIQTGSLPAPAEEGLARADTQLATGIAPMRLPPQPSPAWWPEGGAARLRIEVDCSEAAAGIVWPVQVDFRALAGESGAFNVRSARLLPLTDTDEAGPERPCQLLRAGIAFLAEPGSRSYFLYLDPEPGRESGFREIRASQSRSGVRLENRRMRLSLSAADGFVSAWRLLEPGLELLPDEGEGEGVQVFRYSGVQADRADKEGPAFDFADPEHLSTRTPEHPPPSAAWRLRVLETGPLLARARAEHPDGRIRQVDLGAGQSWAEMSVNSPWSDFFLPIQPALWPEEREALFGIGGAGERRPLGGTPVEATEARWAALHRPDGLTVALALPEAPADATVGERGLRLRGRPHGGRVLLFAGMEADPAPALVRLLAAHQEPPRVRLGVIEERRVREF